MPSSSSWLRAFATSPAPAGTSSSAIGYRPRSTNAPVTGPVAFSHRSSARLSTTAAELVSRTTQRRPGSTSAFSGSGDDQGIEPEGFARTDDHWVDLDLVEVRVCSGEL